MGPSSGVENAWPEYAKGDGEIRPIALHVSAALLTVTVEDVIKRFCVQRFISRSD